MSFTENGFGAHEEVDTIIELILAVFMMAVSITFLIRMMTLFNEYTTVKTKIDKVEVSTGDVSQDDTLAFTPYETYWIMKLTDQNSPVTVAVSTELAGMRDSYTQEITRDYGATKRESDTTTFVRVDPVTYSHKVDFDRMRDQIVHNELTPKLLAYEGNNKEALLNRNGTKYWMDFTEAYTHTDKYHDDTMDYHEGIDKVDYLVKNRDKVRYYSWVLHPKP